ncbi:MAG: 4-amino-4-deoxy-L-arabinose transferase-like glycosyltransferase [Vicingaceae bacterium]|jgi:4-amino-4-deoxy-L-arabinose transferase-like glycosyltransferase
MKTSTQFLLLLLVCICTFFVDIQEFYPDIMEMRNFITAREMLTEGNWWSTTLNLEPRLEKPPFPTWLTAISVNYLGDFDNLFVVRLPSAIVATLMVFFFFGLCRELSKERYLPFIGALVMATSLLVIQQARVNSWDIYTHVFMLGSLWQFLVVKRSKKLANVFWAIFFFALSIYSKGPVSIYALWLPFIMASGIADNLDFIKKHKVQFIFAFVLALILGFSWNIYMFIFQPEASEFVLNKETNSWMNRHTRPFYFYFHFVIYIGIWTVFMISSFFYKYAAPRINRFGNYKFMIFWVLISVLLLSIVPTKKERYLLPALVPMCLVVTFLIYSIWQAFKGSYENKWDRLLVNFTSITIYTIAIALPIVLISVFNERIDLRSVIFTVLIGIVGVIGFLLWKKGNIESNFIVPIVITSIFCLGLLPKASEIYYNNDDFKELAQIQEVDDYGELDFYWQGDEIDVKVMYGVGKKVFPVSSMNILNMGSCPLVFISFVPIRKIFGEDYLKNYKLELLGIFDFDRNDTEVKLYVNRIDFK